MTVLESIVKDLEKLPPPKLLEVVRFVHQLDPERAAKRRAALEATAGCMAGKEGEAFEKAVREEAGRIDADDWK